MRKLTKSCKPTDHLWASNLAGDDGKWKSSTRAVAEIPLILKFHQIKARRWDQVASWSNSAVVANSALAAFIETASCRKNWHLRIGQIIDRDQILPLNE